MHHGLKWVVLDKQLASLVSVWEDFYMCGWLCSCCSIIVLPFREDTIRNGVRYFGIAYCAIVPIEFLASTTEFMHSAENHLVWGSQKRVFGALIDSW